MQEVISIAASSSLGHLCTHLYNVQESYIPYLKKTKITHQNDIFLEPSRQNGRVNYYPRAINIQLNGGFGFLGKYTFQDPSIDLSAFDGIELEKKPRVDKNIYQQNLDEGKPTDNLMLNVENTKFFTDYNKLIYRPYSLLSIEDYTHPEGTHKHFERYKFDSFKIGADEYKNYEDDVDESFRKLLESLDNIQGVSLFSELDNAWSGFTNEMLVHLRDEYFNNGVSSKYNLWCYAIGSKSFTKQDTLTRIKGLIELSKNSSLLFPLGIDQQLSLLLSTYHAESLWHRGLVHAYFVNSIWSTNNQSEGKTTMAEYEANLLRGYHKRNIVNEIRLNEVELKTGTTLIDDPRIIEAVLRGETPPKKEMRQLDLNLLSNASSSKRFFSQYIIPDDEKLKEKLDGKVCVNKDIGKLTSLDSSPAVFETDNLYTEFAQSTGLKDHLKQYRQIIQRVRAPKDLEIVGDKQELVEDISYLIDEYIQGYELEEESD